MNRLEEFETNKKYDPTSVIRITGEISKREHSARYTREGLIEMAMGMGAVCVDGAYIKIEGKNVTVIVTDETNYKKHKQAHEHSKFTVNNDKYTWIEYIENAVANGGLKTTVGRYNIKMIGMAVNGLRFERLRAATLDLSELDTSKMTTMRKMFSRCNVRELNLDNLDSSNVVDMSFMFERCKIKSIDLSVLNTTKVVSMRAMFSECDASEINLEYFALKSVKDMSYMFHGCRTTEIDLSWFNFHEEANVDMRHMFSHVNEKKSVPIEVVERAFALGINDNCVRRIKCNNRRIIVEAKLKNIEVIE